MNKKILLIDDEFRMRKLLADYFKREGFLIYEAENGKRALELLSTMAVDLIVLDIMMPEMDGLEFCKLVRKDSNVPIIIVTAKSEEEDELLGFGLGADDYVTKPFSPKILIAKAKALLKRTSELPDSSLLMTYGDLTINELSHSVFCEKEKLLLTPKEYDLLLFFVHNLGIVLSRDKLLDNVWGMDYFGDLRTVDTHVKRLREKLKSASRYISTVRGSGYKFEVIE